MKRAIYVPVILIVLITVVLVGCGRRSPSPLPSPSPSPTPSPAQLTAAEIMSQASVKFQALNSFHFDLDQVGGGTPITMGIEMTKASGDIVKPDKMQATITGTIMSMSLQVKLVSSGGQIFMTNPLTSKWEAIPEQFVVLSLFDPNTGIAAIMKGLTEEVRLPDEEAGGIPCYHVKGNITSDVVRPFTGSAIAGAQVPTEIWIGKDDFLARRIKLDGQITESEKPGIVRTLTLSAFNQVAVTLPAEVTPTKTN